MILRNAVVDKIRRIFESYGFEPMETPAFESWGLLEVKCGHDLKEQIYRFKDKKNRELGLRYDLTVPLARVIASNPQLPKPFKRYCISRVWRYEKPTIARRREFLQCDADIIGSSEPISDAEVMVVAADCLEAIGLPDFFVRVNNRKILEGMLDYVKVGRERELDIFRAIDKLAKIGPEGVVEELARVSVSMSTADKLLDLIGKKGEPDEILGYATKLLEGIEVAMRGCDELERILEYAREFGMPRGRAIVDLSLARGIDYYTGPIYEIYIKGSEKIGSVAGGGRYDTLIELFGGRPTPATGISLGIERIIELLEKRRAFTIPRVVAKAFVASASESVRKDAVAIMQKLRRSGIPTDFDLTRRRLAAQLEYADKRGFRYAVIVGEKELRENSVVLRDMLAKKQKVVKIDNLVHLLKA